MEELVGDMRTARGGKVLRRDPHLVRVVRVGPLLMAMSREQEPGGAVVDVEGVEVAGSGGEREGREDATYRRRRGTRELRVRLLILWVD